MEFTKDNNGLSTVISNLVMSDEINEFLQIGSPSSLWFSKFVNTLYICLLYTSRCV